MRAGEAPAPVIDARGFTSSSVEQPRDLQRTFQLVLGDRVAARCGAAAPAVHVHPWSNGFSGMLNGLAGGNPGWVAHTITWNASIVYHQPILTNTAFACIQFLIAFGIVWRRTSNPRSASPIVWALGVWWFGEGAGGIFQGGATPFGGGPGGVLFYAVLAVLLWPSEGSDQPFVAARTVGVGAARAIWAVGVGPAGRPGRWSARAVRPRRSTIWWPA